MKKILMFIFIVTGLCILGGCTVLPYVASVLEPKLEDGWAHKSHLEKLINNSKKQLLTEVEKNKASQAICEKKHLDKRKNNSTLIKYANKFCKLEKNDKIYFYNWCMDCGGGNYLSTSYLLVRDGKPIESVSIETIYSKERGKTIPIVKQLH